MSAASPLKALAVVAAPVVAALAALGAITGGLAVTALTAAVTGGPPSPVAIADIPPAMLALYRQADRSLCPQMPWQIVAAIGTIETDNGTSNLPGVHSGANSAGAEGPMQFEPSTFAEFDQPVPAGGVSPPDIYDPVDAVYAATRMLCAEGAGAGDIRGAVFAYNHTDWYLNEVWDLAVTYGMAADGSPQGGVTTVGSIQPASGTTVSGNVATVISFALSQLGVPYLWGGTTAGVGLDCSGLVQLSYRAAGIDLPRTTYEQASYGITVPVAALAPGDLLFFDDGTSLGHVAIYLGQGLMIQAPYTGTVVSISSFSPSSVELARRIIVNP